MSRNSESTFARMPSIDIPRSQFDRSHTNTFTANIGSCIPVYWDEILPGDTVKMTTSKVIRLQTLLHPVMDTAFFDTYWFFVPTRLIWEKFKNFMGESERAWTPTTTYTVPQLVIANDQSQRSVGDLMDYMGLSPYIFNTSVSALPFRAYAKIMDDWFRTESLTDPLIIPVDSNNQNANNYSFPDLYCAYGGPVFQASKYPDYFTSLQPAPQSGPSVQPLNGLFANVGTDASRHDPIALDSSNVPYTMMFSQKNLYTSDRYLSYASVFDTDSENVRVFKPVSSEPSGGYVPTNLYADLGSVSFSINDLRIAFQVQKYYERLAFSGRRYIEIIKGLFGVTSPDARLQRSEYLGGNRVPLTISEVTNNAASSGEFLGDLGGMSRTVDVHEDFVHSFTEHGYLFCIGVARYKHTYGQGIEKKFLRKNTLDFYFPQFANIGFQSVPVACIKFDSTAPSTSLGTVFGYGPAWDEYRFSPDRVCGEMRPEIGSSSLASWNFADYYTQTPTLSDSWIREDKSNVDRALAVTSQVSNQLFANVRFKAVWTRPMPMFGVPGLADHH